MKLEKFEQVLDFYSALSELVCNSQSNIKMLTMLAEDSVKNAPKVVEALEHHIQQVRPPIKLPVLYVIDSIVKNIPSYLELFSKNIVEIFRGVFIKADETTRSKLWKLRQTWKGVFPAKLLHTLDIQINSVDRAWPIVAPPSPPTTNSGSIHLNPNFLTTQKPPRSPTEAEMREELLKKKLELQELQRKKLELELQAKRNVGLQSQNNVLINELLSVNQQEPIIENKIIKEVRKVTTVDLSTPVLSPPSSLSVGESRGKFETTEQLIDWLKSKSGIDKIERTKNDIQQNVVHSTTVLSASHVDKSPKTEDADKDSTRIIGYKSESKQPTVLSPPKITKLNDSSDEIDSLGLVKQSNPIIQTSGKRKSDGSFEMDLSMRRKVEKIDGLFGNKDVDLRGLMSPRPSLSPPSGPAPSHFNHSSEEIRDRRVHHNNIDSRKVWENGPPVWEKNVFLGNRRAGIDHTHRNVIDHRHGQIWQQSPPPPQPWQQVAPWMRPMPPYNQDYCQTAPWQGGPPPPRGGYGPMHPDINQFPPPFNHNLRPRMNQNFPINGGPMHPDVNQFSHGFNSNMRPMINQNHMRPINGHMMTHGGGPGPDFNHFNGPPNIIYNNEPLSRHVINDSRRISPRTSPPNFEQNGNTAPIIKTEGQTLVNKPMDKFHSVDKINGGGGNNLTKQNSGVMNLDVNELYQRLVASGIVPKVEVKVEKEPEEPASFDKPDSLKSKRSSLITALYSGLQCSSCGDRFLPEHGEKYRRHLDWHFRKNRKEKDLARAAKSRGWYLKRGDWVEFVEIQDDEDREESWFEQQQKNGKVNEDDLLNDGKKSVPAGGPEESKCYLCKETFEEFFNNEMDEWHLRPAVNFEGRNYHPLCLVDVKKMANGGSSVFDESMEESENGKLEENAEDNEIIMEEKAETKEEVDENIVGIKEELEEIVDEQVVIKEEAVAPEVKADDEIPAEAEETMETETQEATIDDTETDPDVMECSFEKVQVKQEPIEVQDDGQEMSFDFENVVIKTEPVDPEPEPEVPVQDAVTVDTTLAAVTSSIDGNFELESAPATLPTVPSRIKINMTSLAVVVKNSQESAKFDSPPVPVSIKPALQAIELKEMPMVTGDNAEISGLCAIM